MKLMDGASRPPAPSIIIDAASRRGNNNSNGKAAAAATEAEERQSGWLRPIGRASAHFNCLPAAKGGSIQMKAGKAAADNTEEDDNNLVH